MLLFRSKTSQLSLNIPIQHSQLKLKNLSDDSISKLCKIIIPFYDENIIKQMINHIISAFSEYYTKMENNNQFSGKKRDKLILYLTILSNMFEMKIMNFESVVLPLVLPIFEKFSTILNHFPSDEIVLKKILEIYYSLLNNNVLKIIISLLFIVFFNYSRTIKNNYNNFIRFI